MPDNANPNTSDTATLSLRIFVFGRVQGVGFRYATQREAQRLGVRGWVRNRHDGSVETLIQGDPAQLEAMQAWLEHGPRTAQVLQIKVERLADVPLHRDFSQHADG